MKNQQREYIEGVADAVKGLVDKKKKKQNRAYRIGVIIGELRNCEFRMSRVDHVPGMLVPDLSPSILDFLIKDNVAFRAFMMLGYLSCERRYAVLLALWPISESLSLRMLEGGDPSLRKFTKPYASHVPRERGAVSVLR